jgi:hypothetical protein
MALDRRVSFSQEGENSRECLPLKSLPSPQKIDQNDSPDLAMSIIMLLSDSGTFRKAKLLLQCNETDPHNVDGDAVRTTKFNRTIAFSCWFILF